MKENTECRYEGAMRVCYCNDSDKCKAPPKYYDLPKDLKDYKFEIDIKLEDFGLPQSGNEVIH